MENQEVAALLRSFNNPGVIPQIRRLFDAGIGSVVVVTETTKDKGSTRAWIDSAESLDPVRDRIHLVGLQDPFMWANALNAGVRFLQVVNAARRIHGESLIEAILTVSVEAEFSSEHVSHMCAEMNSSIGVVGTSFDGLKEGEPVSLGRSYKHPRNTGMLIRMEALKHVGFFNPLCDQLGGMEDIDFVLALLVLSPLEVRMLDLAVPLRVGVRYNQLEKEKREQSAMDAIVGSWRELFPLGTPERERIDAMIRAMGLES